VTDCSFSGNSAAGGVFSGQGGGMHNVTSTLAVTNCTFSVNTATNDGGGMYNEETSPTVTNCMLSVNTADFGGGMFNDTNSTPTVSNCSFSRNTATNDGGGIYNENVVMMSVTSCSFSENSAGGVGGGMYNVTSMLSVMSTGFCDNSPDQILGSFTDGGGNSLLYCPPPIAKSGPCQSDLNGDGDVGIVDFLKLLGDWGPCP
jgi:predicted outer membrane repeat protein